MSHCFCEAIPQIDNRTDVLILQHVGERFHPFNTARIVQKSSAPLPCDCRSQPPSGDAFSAHPGQHGPAVSPCECSLADRTVCRRAAGSIGDHRRNVASGEDHRARCPSTSRPALLPIDSPLLQGNIGFDVNPMRRVSRRWKPPLRRCRPWSPTPSVWINCCPPSIRWWSGSWGTRPVERCGGKSASGKRGVATFPTHCCRTQAG